MDNLILQNIKNISYEFFEENRYTITDFNYAGSEYTGMCNNGYTKFHTAKGKAYWLAQNELGHLTRDWKFHVSVRHEDAAKAWNLITQIFLENECRSGMKVLFLKENSNTARGREITIYIFKYGEEYLGSSIAVDFKLSFADEHSEEYWFHLFKRIEEVLEENLIKSNGLANGDLALGRYVSLRNEAFVYDFKSQLHIYPLDESGWNAADQDLPFNLQKFGVSVKLRTNWNLKNYFIIVGLVILIISVLIFKYL